MWKLILEFGHVILIYLLSACVVALYFGSPVLFISLSLTPIGIGIFVTISFWVVDWLDYIFQD